MSREEEYMPFPKAQEERRVIDFNSFAPLKRIAINSFGNSGNVYSYYFMYPLTDEEEKYLDDVRRQMVDNPDILIRLSLSDGTPIDFSKIKIYGNFEFDNPEHLAIIKNYLDKDTYSSHKIPREFNYETNTSVSKGNFIQWTESTDYLKCFKFYHARIGKPKKYIIVRLTANEVKQRKSV